MVYVSDRLLDGAIAIRNRPWNIGLVILNSIYLIKTNYNWDILTSYGDR